MNLRRMVASRVAARSPQRGVAAIEFALVFVILFGVFYALASFGAILYTQQAVTRAAEEGARAANLVNVPTADDARVKSAVYDALANSLVVPISANASTASRRSWIVDNVDVTVGPDGTSASPIYVVTVSYQYSRNQLLPTVPVLGADNWMPERLSSRSTIALRS